MNKSLTVGIILNIIFPGLGHLYFKQKKGIYILLAYFASILASLILIGIITMPLILLYSVYDIIVINRNYKIA